jgi:hypothetical protein
MTWIKIIDDKGQGDEISGQRERFLKMKQIDCCCDFVRYLKVTGDEG